MPGQGNPWGLPGNVVSEINHLIGELAGSSDWLALQFSISNQMIGFLASQNIANPASYRPEIFAAVRFGIDAYLAAGAAEASIETGRPPTYQPPFDPAQTSDYQYGISFTLPGAPEELDRPIWLILPTDHLLTQAEIEEAVTNLLYELAEYYELDGVGEPTRPIIHTLTTGAA